MTNEWRDKTVKPMRQLYERLAPSQRLSLGILAAVVVIALVILVYTAPRTEWVTIRGSELTSEFASFLDGEDIPYKTSPRGEVMIPDSSTGLVEAQAFELGLDEKEPKFFEWIFQPMNLQESSGRLKKKFEIDVRRRVEKVLAGFEGVESGQVVWRPVSDHGLLLDTSGRSSAAVRLQLEGIKRLSPRRARVIGRWVSQALSVKLNRVELTDQYSNDYELNSASAMIDGEAKSDRERALTLKIEDSFDNEYHPSEFRVIVDLTLDRKNHKVSGTKVGDENTAKVVRSTSDEEGETTHSSASIGAKGNTSLNGSSERRAPGQTYSKSDKEYDTEIGSERYETVTPAGDVVAWAITVKLSEDAILRKIRRHKKTFEGIEDYRPTPEDVDDFLEQRVKELRNFSSVESDRVSAQVIAFKPRSYDETYVAEPVSALGGIAGYGREIVLGALALIACLLLYRVAAAGIPEVEDLPDPVVDLKEFLEERERRLAAEQNVDAHAPWPGNSQARGNSQEEAAHLIEAIDDFARARPDDSATVLRQWLHEELRESSTVENPSHEREGHA